jgi:hypothetical protein
MGALRSCTPPGGFRLDVRIDMAKDEVGGRVVEAHVEVVKTGPRKSVVDGFVKVYVLHGVLYPQAHDNGIKNKKCSAPRVFSRNSIIVLLRTVG